MSKRRKSNKTNPVPFQTFHRILGEVMIGMSHPDGFQAAMIERAAPVHRAARWKAIAKRLWLKTRRPSHQSLLEEAALILEQEGWMLHRLAEECYSGRLSGFSQRYRAWMDKVNLFRQAHPTAWPEPPDNS